MSRFMKRNSADKGVQATARVVNVGTQVGEGNIRGAFSMMLQGKSVPNDGRSSFLDEDPLVKIFGEFGPWQLTIEVILFLINITYVFQLVVAEFAGNLFGEFWCARPERLAHVSVEKWKEISGLNKQRGRNSVYDPCFKKNMNYEDLQPDNSSTWQDKGGKIPCTSWEYEDNYSLISEWNLACSHPSPTSLSETIFSIGGLLGSAVSGFFSDRKGRRTYIMYCLVINIFISFFTAYSPNYLIYLAFRGIQGFFIVGCFPSVCILSMELTSKTWVGLVGSIFSFSFPAGYVLISVVAYYVEDWRHLHFAITFLSLSVITVWWILPESPRWLWIQKKHDLLMEEMKRASRMNRTPRVNHEILRHIRTTGPMVIEDEYLQVMWSDLFRTKTIRKLTVVSSATFFFTYIAYYGVLLRLNIMYPVHVFKAQLFTGIVEFTATSISLSTSARHWLSDTLILFVSCISSGVLFLFVNALPDNSDAIPYCLLLCRFFTTLLNTNLTTYVSELYPTKMRSYGIGFANSFNFLALLVTANSFKLEELKAGLPVFLMGMSAVIGGFLILLLPTSFLTKVIPDTIGQVEEPFG